MATPSALLRKSSRTRHGMPPSVSDHALTMRPVSRLIATGDREACVMRADRSVWCWGAQESAFLTASAGGKAPETEPFEVAGVRDATKLAIGQDHDGSETGCVVTTAGGMTCWGAPNQTYAGVLAAAKPVEIPGITDAVQVSVRGRVLGLDGECPDGHAPHGRHRQAAARALAHSVISAGAA